MIFGGALDLGLVDALDSGFLSMLCAKAGAKTVYAVEASEMVRPPLL